MGNLSNLGITALLAKRVIDVTKQHGPQGETGLPGADGKDGLPGVDGKDGLPGVAGKDGLPGVAGKDGLPGVDGKDGLPGVDGKNGRDGKDGADGKQGPQGEVGPPPDHEWQGTKLRFRKPNGKWGKAVDLKGEKGAKGEDKGTVVIGRAGGSAFNPATLGELPGGVLPMDFLLIERNGTAFRVPVSSITAGGDEVAAYSKRTDFISESVFYRGEAAPGSATSASVWRIARVTLASDGDVSEVWAGGTSAFDKAWDDRATLGYS